MKDYKNIIKEKTTKYGLFVTDYETYFKDNNGLKNDLFLDGLHPNDNGYKLLSELISKDLKTLIS